MGGASEVDVIVLLTGAAKTSGWKFLGWTTVGKLARYIVVALLPIDSEKQLTQLPLLWCDFN